jgi:hypothetical protein
MKFLGKLVLWQKLLLIVVALLVPCALMSIFYLKSANDTVRQANAELTGARYTQKLDAFVFEVIRHRAMTSVVLNGDATRKDAVAGIAAAVDKAAAELDAVEADVGRQLGTTADWQASSPTGPPQEPALTLSPDDSFSQHNDFIRKVLDFGTSVAQASGLARDPDPLTSTLVGLSTGSMPEAVNRAGTVRDRATSGVLRGYLSEGDRVTIDMARQETTALLGQIERQLATIDADAPEVRAKVTPSFQKARDAFARIPATSTRCCSRRPR